MITRILSVLLLCGSMLYAADPPPSEASIKQLLDVMQVRKSVDGIMGQVDQIMKNAAKQAALGQDLTPEAQKTFDKCHSDIVAILKEQFTWEKMEPMYMRIYSQSFNQEEVNAMIVFYKTPAGQGVIGKMPLVMQSSMSETMKMMGPMMERVQAMQKEVLAQMHPAKEKKGG